jgi:hypothetical protein
MSGQATSTSKKSYVKRGLVSLALALIGICVSLLMLELAARFLSTPYDQNTGPIFMCDNRLGWIGRPNFQGILETSVFQRELRFNSLGMHDTEHPADNPADTFRIMMLGDSYVHAVQVDEANTAHQILENYLNEQGKTEQQHFEVVSSGVVNWGTNQQLIYYREQGRFFEPDLVILMFFFGNDLMDNLPGNALTIDGINCYAPYFALCNGSLSPKPLAYAPGISRMQNNCSPVRRLLINTMGTLYQHSRLYQQLEPLIIANLPRQQFGNNFVVPYSALYVPAVEAEQEQAWQITQATITRLQQEVTADGAQFAVALISPEIIVRLALLSPAELEIFLRDNPKFVEAQIDRPNQRMAEFLIRQDIPFIDLTTPMINHQTANGTPLYLHGDYHWTVEGNHVVGETLAEWLADNFLFKAR